MRLVHFLRAEKQEAQFRYRQARRGEANAKQRAYVAANVEAEAYRQRRKHLRTYGLEVEGFEALLAKQGGACALCGKPVSRPVVDHNHETGRVRGLLCTPCNIALGFLESRILRIGLDHFLGYLNDK